MASTLCRLRMGLGRMGGGRGGDLGKESGAGSRPGRDHGGRRSCQAHSMCGRMNLCCEQAVCLSVRSRATSSSTWTERAPGPGAASVLCKGNRKAGRGGPVLRIRYQKSKCQARPA